MSKEIKPMGNINLFVAHKQNNTIDKSKKDPVTGEPVLELEIDPNESNIQGRVRRLLMGNKNAQ